MTLSLIVAKSANNVIGKDNSLPWHLPEDLKYFKAVTMGKPIVMGRKTFESIGRPLPGRKNIVVTRNVNFSAEGVAVVHDLNTAIAVANGAEEIMVIGGTQLYSLAFDVADKIYLTLVHAEVEGDAYFPELSAQWEEVSRIDHENDGGMAYSFCVLNRISK